MGVSPIRSGWRRKFSNAFRGIAVGMRGQNSFAIHIPVSIAVVATAMVLGVGLTQFTVLAVCVGVVLSAELFNTSLEKMAKSITHEENEHIRDALDIASGAVLVSSLFASMVGSMIFGFALLQALG